MSLVKVQAIQVIDDELLSETIYSISNYGDKNGFDNELYIKLYSELITMLKRIVNSKNIIVPIRVGNTKTALMELAYKEDGRSYRVANFFQETGGDYVELLELFG